MKVRHPDTGTVHVVRNLRTDMIYGLECGKPGSRATMLPATDDDVTCTRCAERSGMAVRP